jgi:hypothetical protein
MATPKCIFLTVWDDTVQPIVHLDTYLPIFNEDNYARYLFLSELTPDLQNIFKRAGKNFYELWAMLDRLAIHYNAKAEGAASDEVFWYYKILREIDSHVIKTNKNLSF